jgi:hypothetical protein
MREPRVNCRDATRARRISGARTTLPCAGRSGKSEETIIRADQTAQNRPVVQILTEFGAGNLIGQCYRRQDSFIFACDGIAFSFPGSMVG